jgi:cytidylate kinase
LVIALDGPAGSGKTTTAKLVAKALGYLHIDTGAMYRAITLKVLENQIDPSDEAAVSALARSTEISLRQVDGETHVFLDGKDVTGKVRSRSITSAVSAVSSYKQVREVMVREQQRVGANGGVVLEGRDIGTVVFPNADVKIFMVADADERARRRQIELQAKGGQVDFETLKGEILKRDKLDSSRAISPLLKADDAELIDTSRLTIEQQVDAIVSKVKKVVKKK